MFFSPVQLLFFTSLSLGILVSISSTSWFIAWMGLELNLVSFIPLISGLSVNQYQTESALKYFLIQAMASVLFVFSVLVLGVVHMVSMLVVSVSLMIKIGVAPVHFWLPSIVEGMGWGQMMVLLTLQKIAPLVLLSMSYESDVGWLYFFAVISCALVGGWGGYNQSYLRKLLAFSSINHMAWMLVGMVVDVILWEVYLIVYTFVSVSVMSLLKDWQVFHVNQLVKNEVNLFFSFMLFIGMLSMGGFPPFLGFGVKWLMIQELAGLAYSFVLFILVMMNLVTLFYYLRVVFASVVLGRVKVLYGKDSQYMVSNTSLVSFFLNIMGLPAVMLMFSFI